MKCHLRRRPALESLPRQGGGDFVVDVAQAGKKRTRAEVRRMSGASARWVALGPCCSVLDWPCCSVLSRPPPSEEGAYSRRGPPHEWRLGSLGRSWTMLLGPWLTMLLGPFPPPPLGGKSVLAPRYAA